MAIFAFRSSSAIEISSYFAFTPPPILFVFPNLLSVYLVISLAVNHGVIWLAARTPRTPVDRGTGTDHDS